MTAVGLVGYRIGAIADLRSRLVAARWPGDLPGKAWDRGVPVSYLERLAAYWLTASTGGRRRRG